MLAKTHLAPPEAGPPLPFLARDEAGRLDMLRRQAAWCRSSAHLDLFQACSLLTLDRDKVPVVFARALLRTLGQALGQRPIFLRVGSPEVSFDESWLLRVIERLEAKDMESFTFLLSRRIPKEHRRAVAFLVHGLVAAPDRATERLSA